MAEAWRYPRARDGEVIGLLGGSFDPPHMGHVNITLGALKQFRLDRVWWLVSPGNPLKDHGPAPMEQRIAAAEALVDHPRVIVTGIEALLGTRHTAQTLAALQHRYLRAHLVWLMGADNLAQVHKWQDWRQIMQTVPVGVLARPGERISARLSPAARIYAGARLRGWQAELLGRANPPAWCFVNLPMSALSSSAIRTARGKGQGKGR